MTFCSYNVRGLNNKMSFVKDFLHHNNLGLIALLETHVKKDSAAFISNFVASRFSWYFNYDSHYNGRIWLGWDPSRWNVLPLVTEAQHISCKVTNLASNHSFYVSFVYAYNTHIDRRPLWDSLLNFQHSIADVTEMPAWILLGDFNACINLDEMSGTSTIFNTGMREFREFIGEVGITDLNFSGSLLTWWDKNTRNPIQKKLDRVLVNAAWQDLFSMSCAKFLPRGLSDHCPAMVFLNLQTERIFKPFQIFQHIINHPDFLECVRNSWNTHVAGDPWYILTSKLKRVKTALRHLNTAAGNHHDNVIQARNALLLFQEAMPLHASTALFEAESDLCSKLQEALSVEEVFLKQKSRVNWLQLGDNNNSFFFKSCKGRWNSNKILAIDDDQGTTHTRHKDIARIAVNYYQSLLGAASDSCDIDPSIDLSTLSEDQKSMLSATFSQEDVLCTLKNMAKRKSPGPDGFTPEFYVTAWDIVGKDVVSGILYFFSSLELPRIINSTAIALIPKVPNPSHMSQFRPISCCNTLYKCISKMLAMRMKVVMPSLISKFQSAFVPKRIIGDNIMLAQAI